MSKNKILIVEDDECIVAELKDTLSLHGFSIKSVNTIAQFNALTQLELYDLILVDLGLPDGFGNSVIRDTRKMTTAGIIVLSGRKSETDKVLALELGADDYVEKPFRPSELIARIQSVRRRVSLGLQAASGKDKHLIYTFFGYKLDIRKHRLSDAEGREIKLTKTEFDVLSVFVRRPDLALTRDEIVQDLHGGEWACYDRAIDGIVCRLRAKIPILDSNHEVIRTVRGVGYIFSPTEQ